MEPRSFLSWKAAACVALVGGRGLGPDSSISSALGLASPSSPSLPGNIPRSAQARGHGPLLAHGRAVAARGPARWLSPGEAAFLLGAFVELVPVSIGRHNECVSPLPSQKKRRTGGCGSDSGCSSAEKGPPQHKTARAPFPGLLGVTAKVDRQTDNAGPCSSVSSRVRSTLYTAAWRDGRRYLTRFSTEYTDT